MIKVGRFGSRNVYLAPDGRTGMNYREAKAAHANVASLMAGLNEELRFDRASGLGDKAKQDRLIASIKQATGKMPWEVHS